MTVSIELDIDADNALDDIAEVKGLLEALDDDVDFGDLNFDGLTESIEDITGTVEELSDSIDDVQDKLDGLEVDDLEMNINGPEGNTGSGDSSGNDPPVQNITVPQRDIRDLADEATGRGDGGLKDFEIREKASQLSGFSESDISIVSGKENIDSLDINSLRKRASDEGLLGKETHSKSELQNLLKRNASGNRKIVVDTEFGTEGLEAAINKRQKRATNLSRSGPDPTPWTELMKRGTSAGRRKRMLQNARGLSSGISPADGLNLTNFGKKNLGKSVGIPDISPETVRKLQERFSGLGGTVRKLFPNMSQIYNLIAALVPIAVVLGAQLLGVAAAMGAVAVAGASILGLGLLGHGDSMAESFSNAKQEVSDLGTELFNVFQPTMQQFAPIQAEMFDRVPGALNDTAEAMEGLTAYEDTLFQLGGMMAEGLEYSVRAIVRNEEAISQLAVRFAALAGSNIADLFTFLFNAARDNQGMLVSLGNTLKDLGVIFFRIARLVVMFLDSFSPLIDVLLLFSTLLDNKIVQILFAFAAAAYITVSALSSLGLAALSAYAAMGGKGLLGAMFFKLGKIHGMISALIANYTALGNAALWASVAMGAIGAISLGAGVIAANNIRSGFDGGGSGFSGSGVPTQGGVGGGPGGGNTYIDNSTTKIEGGNLDDYATMKGVESRVNTNMDTRDAQEPPNK